MKKLALSVAVAAIAATSVQAKTVYSDDDMYLNLTGEVAFEFVRDVGDGDEIQNKTDNVDLEVKAGYTLDNGVEVFGYYAFEFANWTTSENDKEDFRDTLIDHYVGFTKDGLTVQYGDQDYAVDDFAIRKNLDAKTATEMVLNPDDSEMDGSAEVLLVKFKGDKYYVSASYDLDIEKDENENWAETGFDIFAEAEVVEDVAIGATYSLQDYSDGNSVDKGKYASYGVQVEYTGIDNLTLGASYVYGENYLAEEADDNEASGIDFAAQYKVNSNIKLSGGIGFTMPEADDKDDLTIWYLNGNYNFTKNVDAYAEVYDEDDEQLGLLLGLSVDF